MLQSHARKYEIAINSLEFSSSYLTVSAREVTEAPTDGVIVFGLWMEGASWSMASGGLTDSSPGILYSVSDQSDRCTHEHDTTPLTSYDVPRTTSRLRSTLRDQPRLPCACSCVGALPQAVPAIHLLPVEHGGRANAAGADEAASASTAHAVPTYRCPLYKTTARAGTLSTTGVSTNFILAVDVPSPSVAPEVWIQRGVAIVCDLND